VDEDIVQQLHDWQHIVDDSKGHAVVVMLSGRVFGDAAVQIERLRAAGDELIAAITAVCYAGPLEYMDKLSAAHKAWKEAKNGSQ
jgi:hypothetical protein